MAQPYSQDLRDRVIDAVMRSEMSRRATARRYEISESVAIKWLERVERDGSREPVGFMRTVQYFGSEVPLPRKLLIAAFGLAATPKWLFLRPPGLSLA
jgi:transposase-like protein